MSKAKGKSREDIINHLAEGIDKFERYSQPHSQAMADMVLHLAKRLGLSQADAKAIAEAARLHDIGLHAMSPAYHTTRAALRFEERLDLWRHSIIGEQEMAKREASRYAQLLVRWHHEWWNGSGYPDMLAFEDIPIGARILRAVELYNALTGERPYRAALSKKAALEVLQSSAGIECDPYVVHALLALLEEMNADQEPEATVFPEQAIAPEKLEEMKAEDAIDTDKLNEPRINSLAATETTVHPATNDAASNSSASANPFVTSSLAVASIESTTSEAPQLAAHDETQLKSLLSESFFQLPNPLDSTDEPQAATSAADSPQAVISSPSSTLPTDIPQIATPTTSSTETPQSATSSTPLADAPPIDLPGVSQASIKHTPLPQRLFRSEPKIIAVDDAPNWLGWKASAYNKKSLLAFEASVLRQIQFATIAIPFSGEAKLDWYLKAWQKRIFSNDSRAWAAMAARAMIESTEALDEQAIAQLLNDIYVPGTRLSNPHLRRWFSETDAWWMDNLRRNIETLEDDKQRAQACLFGLQTGDYALSFNEETCDLRRPLATVFWRLAGRFTIGVPPQAQNRSFNYQPLDFIRNARADLLYLNLPAAQDEAQGAQARFEWRECWVKGLAADAKDFAPTLPLPQSKKAYLLGVDQMLRAAAHIKKWAIGCQEMGLISAREINELVKEHRAVRATYSKDVTEVAGGSRSYIIVAERE